jgi:hypothetical protein
MSNNFYTTKTAALKATTADIRNLNAQQIKLNGKPIPAKVLDDRGEFVTDQDLWGTTVTTDENNVVHVSHKFLSNPNIDSYTSWNSSVKSVKDNKAYTSIDASGDPLCNIQTEMIKDSSFMFFRTSLESFSSDLSNLVNGEMMFANTPLKSFSGDLSSLNNGHGMFRTTSLTSFNGDLSSLTNGGFMFDDTPLTSFSSDLSSLISGHSMFNGTNLTSFSSDLSSLSCGELMFNNVYSLTSFNSNLNSLVDGYFMFNKPKLTSFISDLSSLVNGSFMFNYKHFKTFIGDLSSLVNGSRMFDMTSLSPQSVMCIVESIRNIKDEKARYTNAEIPWVTYNPNTQKYSAPFGFMENGNYVYTYNDPEPYTTHIPAISVGQLGLGIDVTNDSSIDQQLQTFAESCYCNSWEELKQEFVNKGWTVTFQYGGSNTSITLSEDEQFRGTPVYARLVEVSEENKDRAEYCTEDGTKYYNIDWGHDVTDYDKYQYFGSLLEACGYYGVIPKKYLEEV